jgi:hypothetical protein
MFTAQDKEIQAKIESQLEQDLSEAKILEESGSVAGVMGPARKATKQAKLRRALARQCILIAKSEGDPLYEKYAKHFAIVKEMRATLQKKYAGRAKSMLRQFASNK